MGILTNQDLLASILPQDVYTAFSKAIDNKLSTYNFQTGNFKELSDKRLQKICSFVKEQTKLDIALHQVFRIVVSRLGAFYIKIFCPHRLNWTTSSTCGLPPLKPKSANQPIQLSKRKRSQNSPVHMLIPSSPSHTTRIRPIHQTKPNRFHWKPPLSTVSRFPKIHRCVRLRLRKTPQIQHHLSLGSGPVRSHLHLPRVSRHPSLPPHNSVLGG